VRLLVIAAIGFATLVSGCCRDAEDCPQNAVVVRVSRAGAPVDGVEVEGASTPWTCRTLDRETLCAPESIADGRYEVLVRVGATEETLEIDARTYPAPPYSCACETPTAEATLELDGTSDADAGPPDAGGGSGDGGLGDDAG
jgi:hypothetical protein